MKNALFLFVGAIVVFVAFLPSYTQLQDLKQKNQQFEQQIIDNKAKYLELKEEKRRLIEDPEYLERIAREKMGLIREGETIYRIVPANAEKN